MSISAQEWKKQLKNQGYETTNISARHIKKLLRSRTGKMIIRHGRIQAGSKVLEVGCGGGKWLVPLAYKGCCVTGLDCSKEVLQRAESYIKRAEKEVGRKLNIELIELDICNLCEKKEELFDVVFSTGVMEHFLPDSERESSYRNQIKLIKRNGRLCLTVPNGSHWQRYQKETKLPGYNVPEIDYTEEQIRKELESLGFVNIQIITYRSAMFYESNRFLKVFQRITDLLLPWFLLPGFLRRKIGTYIFAVGEKP